MANALKLSRIVLENKKPIRFAYGFFVDWSLAMTYFHMANATLPLARSGFTSEFGKGSGGSHSLWSPDKLVKRLLAFANRLLESVYLIKL